MPEENEKAADVDHRRAQLEIDKLDKENRKLDLEISKLKSERTVWVALTSQLATITALVVSIISATMSFYNTQTESKKVNEQTIQDDAKLFNDLLDRANNANSSGSTGQTESKKVNEQTIQDDSKLFNDLLDRANIFEPSPRGGLLHAATAGKHETKCASAKLF